MLNIVGKNAELMMGLLKSWQLTDGNALEGDSLTLSIFSEDIDGIPPKGEKYKVYVGNVFRDEFIISKRSVSLNPRVLRLVLSVAPFSITDSTEYRSRKSASWNNVTIAKVVADCVTPHGFSIFVHPRLQKIEIENVDRTDESTSAFIFRLAKQYDAVAKIVDGVYVIAPKGEVIAASGKRVETITLSCPDSSELKSAEFLNVDVDLDGRDDFNGVKAFHLSTDSGTRKEVVVGSSPFKSIGKDCNSLSEAQQACSTELRRIQREGRKVTINASPNPLTFAEGLVVLDDSFPSAFRGTCSIDSVNFTGRGRQVKTMMIQATSTGA
ncbi:hypothetical protein [Vibrio sp. 10N.261.55.A7]|uniref:hypothetical protein n=1 Tax=Vibrio sp. 10N.261.55.A7 TaxID=1880851 RepID=UPI000C860746|nr:hypothetical protein [Vibrio sp. 10N.261.55.A7]PMJ89829.1 hypothetical protein BCU12_01230 [Vibrio sp. 10N.261.55.A7]